MAWEDRVCSWFHCGLIFMSTIFQSCQDLSDFDSTRDNIQFLTHLRGTSPTQMDNGLAKHLERTPSDHQHLTRKIFELIVLSGSLTIEVPVLYDTLYNYLRYASDMLTQAKSMDILERLCLIFFPKTVIWAKREHVFQVNESYSNWGYW